MQQRELVLIDEDLDAGADGSAQPNASPSCWRITGAADKSSSCAIVRTWPRASPTSRSCRAIETEFVRTLIERNLLAAPADAAPAWPFRLRIKALGGFELVRDGVPMRFTGKAQQRPLDLLKLLVALGGSDVDSQQLTAALWPDADGDAAKTSFDTTLFRLRKLIDVDNALVLSAGKLSLARTARVGRRVGAARRVRGGGPRRQCRRPRRVGRRAPPAACSMPIPVRCWAPRNTRGSRSRATRCARASCARWRALGERLEREGDLATAIDVYRRGLEADNLAESFYRGLMRSLAATGDQAEALNAFRRCRELLSIVLGVKPSAETDHLSREIAAGRAPGEPLLTPP